MRNFQNLPQGATSLQKLKEFVTFPPGEVSTRFMNDLSKMPIRDHAKTCSVVCVIGETGTGKSALANEIIGNKHFKCSFSAESETNKVEGYLSTWFGKPSREPVLVLDTPGIGASNNKDTDHIATIVHRLKQVGYVSTFIIVLDS